jgi:excisionase family DNA binding protein
MQSSKWDHAMSAVQNASEEVAAFVPVERFEPFYITVKQCAARIGLSYWTIYHWIADGKLTNERGLRHAGRSVRIGWRVCRDALDRGELI